MTHGKITTPGNTQLFEDLLNAKKQGTAELKTPAAETKTESKPVTPAETENEKDEKVLISFQMSKTTKKALQDYCTRNDMTVTAGIKKAIREMLQNEIVM